MLWGITSESVAGWLRASERRAPTARVSGFGASPGVAEGPARVIIGADQIGEVQPGEILVAPLTAPSWAPIFGKIVATVTDVGGMMSHAAIVCREYGLPAVTGTAFGTARIKTGQRIRVDGNTGTVTVLDYGAPGMLTVEQNDELTSVGPGTPMGELLRRYWYPIAFEQDFDEPAEQDRAAARRGLDAVQDAGRPVRHHRRALPAPARLADLRRRP